MRYGHYFLSPICALFYPVAAIISIE